MILVNTLESSSVLWSLYLSITRQYHNYKVKRKQRDVTSVSSIISFQYDETR